MFFSVAFLAWKAWAERRGKRPRKEEHGYVGHRIDHCRRAFLLVVAMVFARSAAKRRAERQQRAEAVEARQEARALEQRAAERERTAEEELARAERERAAARGHAQRADEVDPDIET